MFWTPPPAESALTGRAALGWLADRLGLPNPVARAADSAGSHTTAMPAALTVTALAATAWTLATGRHERPGSAEPPAATCPEGEGRHAATTCEPHDRDQSADTADAATAQSR
ncbi:hypothetical protein [Streptomyces sp. NPDC050121]|uniref:hypothetical protein n=1 Tax=Streptomyces sp. NPDC050121 TaxID=3365601 RepID=UPI0037BD8D0F